MVACVLVAENSNEAARAKQFDWAMETFAALEHCDAGASARLPHVFVNGTASHTMLMTFRLGTVTLETRDVPAPPAGTTNYSGKLRLVIISP